MGKRAQWFATFLLAAALAAFYELRDNELKKKPSTSELIDWIQILLAQGAKPPKAGEKLPYLGALLKHEDDLMSLHTSEKKARKFSQRF